MSLDRRLFLRTTVALPITMAFTPLIGEVAGGLSVPMPHRLEDYVRWQGPVTSPGLDASLIGAWMFVAWAPPGEKVAQMSMYGVQSTVPQMKPNPDLLVAARWNLLDSLLDSWERDHYPGWARMRASRATGRVNEDGDPEWENYDKWTRIGYLRWLKPSEARQATLTIEELTV